MRTNIDIDDRLLEQAMKVGGFKTKKAAVEGALRLLAGKKAYRDVLALRGKVAWDGDPREMRRAKGR
jgi:Arc/MetJ family transcription regulator